MITQVVYNEAADGYKVEGELENRWYCISHVSDPEKLNFNQLHYIHGWEEYNGKKEPNVYDACDRYCDDGPPEGYYIPVKITLDRE